MPATFFQFPTKVTTHYQSSTKKTILLFLIVFVHVSLLDLFFVTFNGPVFLWEENLRAETILVHLAIATITTLVYSIFTKFRQSYRDEKYIFAEKVWLVSSLFLVIAIAAVFYFLN